MTINDLQQRIDALDPTQSYIVQAPAGSGKTALLTQRVLKLLSLVQYPEEIIALTFTKKAAAEMRQRVIQSLQFAKNEPEPISSFEKKTWTLAKAALKQSKNQQWQLLDNPNRLRILTIDALCASLIRQMPLLSQFGGQAEICDTPHIYYQLAARRLLQHLDNKHAWTESLSLLLLHLDNKQDYLEKLFIQLLAQREQWLPHILAVRQSEQLREYLEKSLKQISLDAMSIANNYFPNELTNELLELINNASIQLAARQTDALEQPILHCKNMESIPTADNINCFNQWQGIAKFLLTNTGEIRKQITKDIGFPAPSSSKNKLEKSILKSMKDRMSELLVQLQEHPEFKVALSNIQTCPPFQYEQSQWQVIKALSDVLPILAAQLTLVYSQHNVVDFSEVSSGTLRALGNDESPTDLALSLDYKIQHLLIDEFQDTSIHQFSLIEKLIQGWQINDGRSLFLVGDPMQSIYRFRQAEVGLFIRAKRLGIADIHLNFLQLSTNFRSQAELVKWNNQQFKAIFPQLENMSEGAICYAESIAAKKALDETSVVLHECTDAIDEANQICHWLKEQNHNQSIAILVKARSHLQSIIPLLKKHNIPFQAIELENLYSKQIIHDLFCLTKVLLNPHDRTAWLSVLRAPWCGLSLTELHELVDNQFDISLLEQMADSTHPRIKKIYTLLSHAYDNRQRMALDLQVKSIWQALDGIHCLTDNHALDDAEHYFKLLSQHQLSGDLLDTYAFEAELEKLYAKPYVSQSNIQVMTIHKSKGLEFDTVILPGLNRYTTNNQSSLFLWSERPTQSGTNDLLIAPIKSVEAKSDAIYQYLKQQETKKLNFESQRLLYVACTRAINQLHLFASIEYDDDDKPIAPNKNSLLAHLWPQLTISFKQTMQLTTTPPLSEKVKASSQYTVKRLSNDYFKHPVNIIPVDNRNKDFYYSPWQLDIPRHTGIIIHQELYLLGIKQRFKLEEDYLNHRKRYWQKYLSTHAFTQEEQASVIDEVINTLQTTLLDKRGLWILTNKSSQHVLANIFEHELTVNLQNKYKKLIIDRSFVENKIRWVIDYKTINHAETINIKTEQHKHQQQLHQYAYALKQFGDEPICLALYYPQIALWHTWDYQMENKHV